MEQQPNTPQGDMKFDAKDINDNTLMAALSYIGILVFIPLLLKKDSPFVQAHAKQGLVLFIAMIFGAIPVIGWLWAMFLLVINVIALVNVLQGKLWKIPGAYELSQKFNI